MMKIKYGVFFISIIFFSHYTLYASEKDTLSNVYDNYMIHGGVGLGTYSFATIAGGSLLSATTILTLQYSHHLESNIGYELPRNIFGEVSIMYGFYQKASYGGSSISCGISFLQGTKRGNTVLNPQPSYHKVHDTEEKFVPGLVVEGQLFAMPISNFGAHFSLQGNLNSFQPYLTLNVGLCFGKLSD